MAHSPPPLHIGYVCDVLGMCWVINCICRCRSSEAYLTEMVPWDLYLFSCLRSYNVNAVKLNTVESEQLGNCWDLSQLVHQHHLNKLSKNAQTHTHSLSAPHTVHALSVSGHLEAY